MIRVLLVDDEQLVRSGILGLLELREDLTVVGEAAGGREAIAMVRELRPEVMLLDVRMPGVGGLEVLSRLREEGILPPTVVLTTFDDDEVLLRAIRAGARGFLLQDVSLERLADAVHVVARGGTSLAFLGFGTVALLQLGAAFVLAQGARGQSASGSGKQSERLLQSHG